MKMKNSIVYAAAFSALSVNVAGSPYRWLGISLISHS